MKSRNRYYNPNPQKKETGDCVVRALCKALGAEWNDVYIDLFKIGYEIKEMPNMDNTWKEYLNRNGFKYHSVSNKKGAKRPTVQSFATANKKGTFVVRVANHIVTVVDGYYYDTWDCGDKSVYGYYEKIGE